MTLLNKIAMDGFVGLSSLALLLQSVPIPASDIGGITGPVERLTLVAALVFAVAGLWRKSAKQDERLEKMADDHAKILISMAEKVTQALTSVVASQNEARKAVEELGAAMDNVADNVAALAAEFERTKPRDRSER